MIVIKLESGRFRVGEKVVVSIHGKKYSRKVFDDQGKPYIKIEGGKAYENDISNNRKGHFDKAAYDLEYVKKNCTLFTVKVPKEQGESWKKTASDLNMSMNAFIIYCVEKEIHG